LATEASELPVQDVLSRLSLDEQGCMIRQVMCQGMPAIGWCMVRSNAYFEKYPGSSFGEQDAAAARDYLNLIGQRGE
jgi:hypothetical protein